MNIGVFGGTFDPPHTGHLIVAQDAALALGLDRILFVPAARPPHKRGVDVTAPAVRAEMLQLAISDDARFGMDTLELDRPGASYTVDTLRELAAREPLVRWTLLIGADQYEEFATWRDPDEIRRLAQLAVLTRGGTHGGAADAPGAGGTGPDEGDPAAPVAHRIGHGDVALQVTRIDISATEVRRRVAAGLPIRYLVPRAVEEFIFERKLYLRNGTPVAG
ncbi:MAG TPA: nicotinate-nucleotide adenylyltransferase [Longimicrobiales bacterium]|nr:nicotinate-nucleotide adenylyltransferase [Longimicrobiales bacterium]